MDTLDDELRRILRDPDVDGADVDGPGVESALAGVHALHRRRTTARGLGWAAVPLVVVGVAVILGPGGDSQSGPPSVVETPDAVDLTGAVPWSDRQDYEPWPPEAQEEIRPDASPCRTDDLELVGATMEGAGGHSGTWVRYTNAGETRCTLKGFPRLSGSEGVVEPEHGTFFPQPEQPATVDPGETAVVVIETSMSCDPQTATFVLQDVHVLLDDGTPLHTRRDLQSSCPIKVGSWYREPFHPTEPPSRFEDLRASIAAPASVRAGGVLQYVVTLRNTGVTSTDLSPCPGFRQLLYPLDPTSLGPGKPLSGGTWRLSCDTDPTIPPGGTQRYEMRLDVPQPYASSPEVLIEWELIDNLPDYGAQTWIDVVP